MTSMISASRALRLVVLDRDDRLDPPVEVAIHQVGRADVPLALAAVLEAPDPRVLEELADDRADADALGDARQARLERAGAADDQVDVDAGLRRRGRAPRSTATSTIALSLRTIRAGRPACGVADLALDEVQEPRPQAVRRDEQPAERPLARQAGQDVEQVGDVGADLRAGRSAGRGRRTAGRSSGCSCRSRCGRSGAGRSPRAGRRAPSSSAS